jgi:hypothetical protein
MAIGGTRRRLCGGCGVGVSSGASGTAPLRERRRRSEQQCNAGDDHMLRHG